MATGSPVRGLRAVSSVVAVVVAFTGCTTGTGSSRSTTAPVGPATSLASAAPASSVASSPGRAATTTTASTSPTAGGSTTATLRPCPTSQFGAAVTAGAGAGAGHAFPYLVLTNKGTTACTLTGFPGVSFVGDGNGTQLGAAATREAPGVPVTTLTLAPGASAHSQLSIASAGSYDATTCRPKAADGLRVYPPDQTQSLFVATTGMTACQNAAIQLLVVRPLQEGAA